MCEFFRPLLGLWSAVDLTVCCRTDVSSARAQFRSSKEFDSVLTSMFRCHDIPSRHTAQSRVIAAAVKRNSRLSARLLLAIGVAIGFASCGALHHSWDRSGHGSGEITNLQLASTMLQFKPAVPLASDTSEAGGCRKVNAICSKINRTTQGTAQDFVSGRPTHVGQLAVKAVDAAQTLTDQRSIVIELVVATGANSAYFHGLKNLVGSVHYWCMECRIVVYNLGLNEQQMSEMNSWCKVALKWKHGIKLQGPGSDHVKQPKQYAWKPFAILETVDEHREKAGVMWIDAGSTITGPIMPTIFPLLARDGHFLVQGQDLDMTRLSHQDVYGYFNYSTTEFANRPSYAGNTVGFVHGSEGYHKILLPWADCAAKRRCIAPRGSSTSNHRFDQTALSIIAYKSGLNITAHTELLLATRVECYKPHERVVWTSRAGESCYQKHAVC